MEYQWTYSLFECCVAVDEADEEGRDCVCICPAQLHSRINRRFRGEGGCACLSYTFAWPYCGWLLAAPLRKELRQKYSLPEEPCSDCMIHLCCSPLAVWQEYRELEIREGYEFYQTERSQKEVNPAEPKNAEVGMLLTPRSRRTSVAWTAPIESPNSSPQQALHESPKQSPRPASPASRLAKASRE